MGTTETITLPELKRKEPPEPFPEWNILATAQRWKEHYLLRLLNDIGLGRFRRTAFRDVIVGHATDVNAFLGALQGIRNKNPRRLRPLGQIVPGTRARYRAWRQRRNWTILS